MLEESAPSIWAAVHGWFTPTVLFVLLNLVIGTIAVTSKGNRTHHQDDEDRKLQRAPSVLERIKSISLYRHRSGEIPLETAAPAPAPAQASIEPVETFETLDEAYEAAVAASSQEHHFSRSQSDSLPTAGEMPEKLAGKLKKSASAKSAFSHFEMVEIPRRPETVREVGGTHGTADEEVDAKADDFINRFRQQLKLQRLDSIIRYKEMINRGK